MNNHAEMFLNVEIIRIMVMETGIYIHVCLDTVCKIVAGGTKHSTN